MEIRDFASLVNKYRLIKEYNKKLADTKSNTTKKRMAPKSQGFEHTPPPKKLPQFNGYEGKQPQGPIIRQDCSKCGKGPWGKTLLSQTKRMFQVWEARSHDQDCIYMHQPPTPKLQHPGWVFTLNVEGATSLKELK